MPTPNHAAAGPRVPPPRHKMALLTWPGAWALITLILWGLGPVMATWPLPLRTLVISVLMVLALTWVVIPSLTRVFSGWLAPAPPAANRPKAEGEGFEPSRRLTTPNGFRGRVGEDAKPLGERSGGVGGMLGGMKFEERASVRPPLAARLPSTEACTRSGAA